jgi:hypothetical protein
MCLCVAAVAVCSLAPIVGVTVPDVLRMSDERRTAIVSVALSPFVVIIASVIAASAMATAAVLSIVAVVAMLGDGTAPTAPGYLDRAPVDAAPAPAQVKETIRFLSPVDDVAPTASIAADTAIDDEIRRLQDCETRALNSRHAARAAAYRQRWIALIPTVA